MAELDGDREAGQTRRERGDVFEPRVVVMDPRRELKEHVAELARLGQRCQRRAEESERLVDRLRRKFAGVDLAAVRTPGARRDQSRHVRGQ